MPRWGFFYCLFLLVLDSFDFLDEALQTVFDGGKGLGRNHFQLIVFLDVFLDFVNIFFDFLQALGIAVDGHLDENREINGFQRYQGGQNQEYVRR